ncbi:unnamed protein product, partial [Pylaiella littoralis]
DKNFRELVYTLMPKANIPTRRDILDRMQLRLKMGLRESVAEMLTGQYVSMTTDGWTSSTYESYISFTVVYVEDDWKIVTLALSCSKKEGSITEEDLAAFIEAMVKTHGLTGRVLVGTIDYEPSMVNVGRILTERGVFTHLGCACHRLECVTSLVFDAPGVNKTMALARSLVTSLHE